jgi:hypothetical protein
VGSNSPQRGVDKDATALEKGASVGSLTDETGEKAKYFKMLNLCADWLSSYLPHALTKIDRVTMVSVGRW